MFLNMKTYSVEPEFGERCIVKLEDPLADGNFADIGAALLFISPPGDCVLVGVLQQDMSALNILFHWTKDGTLNITDEGKNLAGFCIILLVLALLFSSRCTKRSIISETEIQQKNQRWEDNSQNHLVGMIRTFIQQLY